MHNLMMDSIKQISPGNKFDGQNLMTYQEAISVRDENQYLKGKQYEDHRLLHNDTILELVVTPQDHPFYPEFLQHYLDTGSYEKASGLIFQRHGDDIIYAVKCVLN